MKILSKKLEKISKKKIFTPFLMNFFYVFVSDDSKKTRKKNLSKKMWIKNIGNFFVTNLYKKFTH